ncbi:signal recognition particle-docking protein FtsY [Pusillimonas sp. SM2304]|uniref:signal recognition particle-docking protein FtsY n=1 Tax=Pusillimonas sp. SM2304 TaxID=3073241 RepID=UPI0028767A1D|nr:signal recognition particle-docking protein FtsY [Pusillimonas sp. SM2304]MDS1140509.1 signal recognition particle-docking protein FtsY [Pusillimonas sp. SM2304]
MFSFFKKKKPAPADSAGQAVDEQGSHDTGLPQGKDAAPSAGQDPAAAPLGPPAEPLPGTPDAASSLPSSPPPAAHASPAAPDVADDAESRTEAPGSPTAPAVTEASETPSTPAPLETPESPETPETPEPPVAAPAPAEKGSSWLARLKKGLSRTGQSLGGLFVGVKVDESLFEELETALIMADAGVEASDKLLTALRARVRKEHLEDAGQVKAALRDILAEHLAPLEKSFPLGKAAPLVVMIAGVNGAGKTTSIGKLANHFQAQGSKVLLAAGDTFRAAAREQLVEWGARNNVSVIAQDGGDPAAVAFDAVNAGRAREAGVVMIDTAGRLPTQLHLMEELKKIKRVIGKADDAAPHEVLLVIDGNTGQNAIAQIRAFDAAINLTGLVVTKLDGTAKGGTLAAVAAGSQGVRPVPVYWIGVGEGMNDLQPFVAREFAAALLGD